MSSSRINCRACNAPLALRHHTGQVYINDLVRVILEPHGARGPVLRMTCSCGAIRNYAIRDAALPRMEPFQEERLHIC